MPSVACIAQAMPPEPVQAALEITGKVAVDNIPTWPEYWIAAGIIVQLAMVAAAIYFGWKNKKLHEAAEEQNKNAQAQLAEMRIQNSNAEKQKDLLRKQHLYAIAPVLTGEIEGMGIEGMSTEDNKFFFNVRLKNITHKLALYVNIFIFSKGVFYATGESLGHISSEGDYLVCCYETPHDKIVAALTRSYDENGASMLFEKAPLRFRGQENFELFVIYCDFEYNAHVTFASFEEDKGNFTLKSERFYLPVLTPLNAIR